MGSYRGLKEVNINIECNLNSKNLNNLSEKSIKIITDFIGM